MKTKIFQTMIAILVRNSSSLTNASEGQKTSQNVRKMFARGRVLNFWPPTKISCQWGFRFNDDDDDDVRLFRLISCSHYLIQWSSEKVSVSQQPVALLTIKNCKTFLAQEENEVERNREGEKLATYTSEIFLIEIGRDRIPPKRRSLYAFFSSVLRRM